MKKPEKLWAWRRASEAFSLAISIPRRDNKYPPPQNYSKADRLFRNIFKCPTVIAQKAGAKPSKEQLRHAVAYWKH